MENKIPEQKLKHLEEICSKISSQQGGESSLDENRLYLLCIAYPNIEPDDIAKRFIDKYKSYENKQRFVGNHVISVFKQCKLSIPNARKEYLLFSKKYANMMLKVLEGDDDAMNFLKEEYSKINQHRQIKRLILISFINQIPGMQYVQQNSKTPGAELYNAAMRLYSDNAEVCFDKIYSYLMGVTNTSQESSSTQVSSSSSTGKSSPKSEYERTVKFTLFPSISQKSIEAITSSTKFKQIEEVCIEISGQQRSSFLDENRFLLISIEHPTSSDNELGEIFIQKYGVYRGSGKLSAFTVGELLRKYGLSALRKRESYIPMIRKHTDFILRALEGDESAINSLKKEGLYNSQLKRLVLLVVIIQLANNISAEFYNSIMRLNKTFAEECFNAIYSTITKADKSSNATLNKSVSQKAKSEQSEESEKLRTSLERTKLLLKNLQENFETQLEESKTEEQEKLLSLLNSEKYGYILDLLFSTKKGFSQMRQKKIPVPMELKNVQTLTRRLSEFFEDFGIEPIRELNEELIITSNDTEKYQYEGSPFKNSGETKLVEIVSPGWQIADRDIILSNPKVREMTGDE